VVLARAQFAFHDVVSHRVSRLLRSGSRVISRCSKHSWLWTGREVLSTCQLIGLKISPSRSHGVVSGIVMAYQFGTNWSTFRQDRPVHRPLMAYEVLTAFFPGRRIPRRDAVRPWSGSAINWHFSRTLMVATGTLISAFWILSAQFPGCRRRPATASNADGQFVAADWIKASFSIRRSLTVFVPHGARGHLTTALVVGAVGAFHLLAPSASGRPRG